LFVLVKPKKVNFFKKSLDKDKIWEYNVLIKTKKGGKTMSRKRQGRRRRKKRAYKNVTINYIIISSKKPDKKVNNLQKIAFISAIITLISSVIALITKLIG